MRSSLTGGAGRLRVGLGAVGSGRAAGRRHNRGVSCRGGDGGGRAVVGFGSTKALTRVRKHRGRLLRHVPVAEGRAALENRLEKGPRLRIAAQGRERARLDQRSAHIVRTELRRPVALFQASLQQLPRQQTRCQVAVQRGEVVRVGRRLQSTGRKASRQRPRRRTTGSAAALTNEGIYVFLESALFTEISASSSLMALAMFWARTACDHALPAAIPRRPRCAIDQIDNDLPRRG